MIMKSYILTTKYVCFCVKLMNEEKMATHIYTTWNRSVAGRWHSASRCSRWYILSAPCSHSSGWWRARAGGPGVLDVVLEDNRSCTGSGALGTMSCAPRDWRRAASGHNRYTARTHELDDSGRPSRSSWHNHHTPHTSGSMGKLICAVSPHWRRSWSDTSDNGPDGIGTRSADACPVGFGFPWKNNRRGSRGSHPWRHETWRRSPSHRILTRWSVGSSRWLSKSNTCGSRSSRGAACWAPGTGGHIAGILGSSSYTTASHVPCGKENR